MKQSKYHIINKILIITLFLPLFFIYSCGDDPVVGPEKGTIKGQIFDYLTNEPLEGCLVFTEPGTESVFSDAKGNFTINNATPGEYSIKSAKVNYKTSVTKIAIRNNNTTISNLLMFVGVGTVNLDSIVINQPPKRPTPNYPLNESKVGISTTNTVELSWICTDPENDEMTYTLSYGQSSDKLTIIEAEIYEKKYKLKDLEINKSYYWQIEAKDKYGNKTKSSIFSFETQNLPPTEPIAFYPANNAKLKINNIKSLNLSWSSNDPENGSLKYNIYFSDNLVSIPKIASDIKSSSYRVDNLEIQKTYFWKIEAIDDLGQKTISQVFSFDMDTVGNDINDIIPNAKIGLLVYMGFEGEVKNSVSNFPAIVNNIDLNYGIRNIQNTSAFFQSKFNSISFTELGSINFLSYSTAFWIKPSKNYGYPLNGTVTILSKSAGTYNSSFSVCITNSKLTIYHYNYGTLYSIDNNKVLPSDVWTHIAITYNKENKNLKLYVDNILEINNILEVPGISPNIVVSIGMDINNNNRVFNGILDEFYLYNKELSQSEVGLIYNK